MKTIHVGNLTLDGEKLFLIAGPCVIEGYDRTLMIGREIKKICERLGVQYIFKASYDKANRSSFHSFRGPGLEKGLEILADIKKELQVPVKFVGLGEGIGDLAPFDAKEFVSDLF